MFYKSDPSVRWGRFVFGLLAFFVVVGLGAAEPKSVPLQERTRVANSKTLFSELGAATTGIEFVNPIDTKHPLKRLYTSAFGGGGVAAIVVPKTAQPNDRAECGSDGGHSIVIR